jgi:hypothetical protein
MVCPARPWYTDIILREAPDWPTYCDARLSGWEVFNKYGRDEGHACGREAAVCSTTPLSGDVLSSRFPDALRNGLTCTRWWLARLCSSLWCILFMRSAMFPLSFVTFGMD